MLGLKRIQFEALFGKAQSALISQAEFFEILNHSGVSGVLAQCAEKGVIALSKPARSEMQFERMLFQEYCTNNDLFFTYNHHKPVLVDIKNWRLSIEGDGIARPFSLDYDDLMKLPCKTVTRYLECADNGRAFYASLLSKKAPGVQWQSGGWGLAEWTGVPLADILKLARIKREAIQVMPVGLDSTPVMRPMPVDKAMEEDTLLAYIMNGGILPADHRFPLRAVVPGWAGISSIKWVTKIVVSTRPIHVPTNTSRYVLIGRDYPPQPPAMGHTITTGVVKSACCMPWNAILRAGHQLITGYAWSPFGKVAKVEVSLDGGRTYEAANLTGPNIERAGTRWEFHFHAEPGRLTIAPRATDEKGNTQSEISEQEWNRLGYLFGAVVPHPVTVSASEGETYGVKVESATITMAGCC